MLYLHSKPHDRPVALWELTCQGCAGCTGWQQYLAPAIQSSLLSTSHVHTSVSLAVSRFCQTFMRALQVVEVSARYDDSCVAGSNNRDREGTLLQVRATAANAAAHLHS